MRQWYQGHPHAHSSRGAEPHLTHACARATVACNITAAASEGKRRPDVDVVVVMDRSGSMEAERKLELCKETTELLIEQLRPSDRFGLVSFDHRVKTNTALVSASSDVARAVKSLRPGGTTNLSGGLFAGLGLLSAAPAAERIRAVLLLTDGLANAGITEEQPLIAATKSLLDGTSTGLYTFGYGSDHNAKLLQAIAGAAGDGKGSYYFIETAEKVVGAFADCLGGLLSVAAQNVVVEVKASAGRIARVRREGATRVDDRTWTVPLGDVFEEEQRDVLVEVELLGSQNVEVSFALRYVDAANGRVSHATATASVAVDAALAQTAVPDAHVTEQRARLDTADALLSARECADRRDIAGARRVLESQKAKIAALKVAAVTGGLVERLAHDLAVVLEGLANEDAYRARGRQWMTSKMMGHQMQRCMEDPIQTRRKVCLVSRAAHGARAQRLPQHEQKIVQGRDDARDVSQKAFCASADKSGAGVLHSTGLGGVMVASAVRDGLARVQFRAKPTGETNGRPANPHRRCDFVATDIFSSAGAGAPPGPLLVPLSQKSSSARGPGLEE